MLIVIALWGYAALTMVAAPVLLTRGRWRLRFPLLALRLWHAVVLSGAIAFVSGITVAVVLAMQMQVTTPDPAADAIEPTAIMIVAWLALAAVGALIALVSTRAEAASVYDREAERHFVGLMSLGCARSERMGGHTILIIDSSLPVACTAPGRRCEVIVSSLLEDELSPWELRAVIEHERAHLRHHHVLAKRLSHLNSACLPQLVGARELDRATKLLIELIADDCAARVCGRHHVACALERVSELSGSAGMIVRSERVRHRPVRQASVLRRRALFSGC